MSNLVPFCFENNPVKVVQDDQGNTWFIAMEIAGILGYSDAFEMTKRLDDDEKSNLQIAGLGPQQGGRGVAVINESGLYSSVIGSRKPEAKRFKKWVTSEVIPSIRKTGAYSVVSNVPALPDFSNPVAAARAWADAKESEQLAIDRERIAIATKAQIGAKREATAMATASAAKRKANKLEIELDQSKQYATIKRVEAITLKQYRWMTLKLASDECGKPAVDVFDANYKPVKSYHSEAWKRAYGVILSDYF